MVKPTDIGVMADNDIGMMPDNDIGMPGNDIVMPEEGALQAGMWSVLEWMSESPTIMTGILFGASINIFEGFNKHFFTWRSERREYKRERAEKKMVERLHGLPTVVVGLEYNHLQETVERHMKWYRPITG